MVRKTTNVSGRGKSRRASGTSTTLIGPIGQALALNAASQTHSYLQEIWQALRGEPAHLARLAVTAKGALRSVFCVTDLATATIGAASLAIAELASLRTGSFPASQVDRRLASFWFRASLRPQGWSMPPTFDEVAGDYQAAEGWIRLHTNAPHHRDAAMAVLKTPVDRKAVERAVAHWDATALETAIVANKGCAAAMCTLAQWSDHPQGHAVAAEPLLHQASFGGDGKSQWPLLAGRPLHGIRVLDLTRILAGPVATRFLAAFGAEVLRIDPYGWEERNSVPEVVLGKRCARLDLKTFEGRQTLERLLVQADVFVHGYRPEALAALGFGPARRRHLNPGLVDVGLDAYGWTGPWRGRRGFDSLIQMSTGIADAGMRAMGRERPTPLPVQAIDHATGYLLAAACIRGLIERLQTGRGFEARASLARTAQLLISGGRQPEDCERLAPEQADDLCETIEQTGWGPAHRIRPPASIEGIPMRWELPARQLGYSPPAWSTAAL